MTAISCLSSCHGLQNDATSQEAAAAMLQQLNHVRAQYKLLLSLARLGTIADSSKPEVDRSF
ncbi:hypothetical protein EON66_11555 [archaeon]|nr:MAG: hypothetical protein EON66_11555 [archaeon]